MPDRDLRITTSVDLSGIQSGMAAAQSSVEDAAASMRASFASVADAQQALKQATANQAQILAQVGGAINENNAAWGVYQEAVQQAAAANAYLAEQAAAATAAVSEQAAAAAAAGAATTSAAGSFDRMQYSMAYGTSRIASYAGGMSSLGYSIGSVAARSQVLAPILQGLFYPAAAIAMADIIYQIGADVKKWYDNTVLLKGEMSDLVHLVEQAGAQMHQTAWRNIEQQAQLMRAGGNLAGAAELIQQHIGELPVKLNLKIKQSDLDELNSHVAPGIRDVVNQLQRPDLKLEDAGKELGRINEIILQLQTAQTDFMSPEELRRIQYAEAALNDAWQTIRNLQTHAQGTVEQGFDAVAKQEAAKYAAATKKSAQELQKEQRAAKRTADAISRELGAAWRGAAADAAHYAAQQRSALDTNTGQFQEGLSGAMAATRAQIADLSGALNAYYEGQRQQIEANATYSVRAFQAAARNHKIGWTDELAYVTRVYRNEHDALVSSLNAQLVALDKHDRDYLTEKQRLNNEINAADQKLRQQIQTATAQAAAQQAQAVKHLADEISRPMDKAMDGVMMGTQRFSVAWRRMGAEMVASWAETMVQIAAKHLATEIIMTTTHNAGNEARVASDATAAAQSDAIGMMATMRKIARDAAKAASGAFQAVVGIPVIGPILAPPAAGAAYAGVMAMGALASAAGGQWQVPAEQLTMLHRNEMVLPASHAEPLRRIVSGGGGGAMNANLTVHNEIHAIDAAGLAEVLDRHSGAVAGLVRRQLRAHGFNGGRY